ncbi:ABC transporter substrate-binding protein [Nocardia asteroides]|uniref:ABC transporter substrate-binding protein n=1 Tax=Nocardia asteroides TaxID=1824 RepID=UPI001E5C3329|nr:ABC transporter substrate-binding protein [Nocardia asteroides]UGT62417.1 ABC transporter substrate-binding protein [Nocardia asteroides]
MSAEHEEVRRSGNRLGRSRAWPIAAVIAVVAVVVAGVLLATRSGSDAAADSPARSGTLTYAVAGTQVSLDPAVAATAVTSVINRNIFDSLVVQTGPESFGPWLASEWSVAPDGRTYTFTLRAGVTFHDGTPLDAAAVRATLDHVVDPQTKSAYAASLITPYQETRVLDARRLEVVLKQPFTPFLQALSTPSLGIQSPQALAAPEYRPVGTGPFAFERWEQGKRETLVRNEGYTSPPTGAENRGAAYLDRLVFEFVPEDATRYGALISGQVQGIAGVPPVSAGDLSELDGFELHSTETPGLNYNVYLNRSRGALRDPLVRRALSSAVDVEALVRSVYFGRYPVADNALSPTTAGYDGGANSELAKHDPDAARRLLDQAGWTGTDADGYRVKDGRRLTLVWPYWPEGTKDQREVIAEGFKAQARTVGIEIARPTVDTGTYVDRYLIGGEYDLVDVSFARPTPDVLRFAFFSANTYAKAGGNVALVDSPEIDAWVTEAAADPARAGTAYSAVQREVLKQSYIVPVYTPVSLTGFADSVRGLVFDAQTYPRFADVWLAS